MIDEHGRRGHRPGRRRRARRATTGTWSASGPWPPARSRPRWSTPATSSPATTACRSSRPTPSTRAATRSCPPCPGPVIVKHLVAAARAHGADAVAHGCTGKGNDQVRFEVSTRALAPDLEVLAPVRAWGMTREDVDPLRLRPRHPDHGDEGEGVLDRRQPLGPGHRVRRDGGPVGRAAAGRVVADQADRRPSPATSSSASSRACRSPSTASSSARPSSSPTLNERRGRLRLGSHRHGREPPRRHQEPRDLRVPRQPGADHGPRRPRVDLPRARPGQREKSRLEPRYAELIYDGLWFCPLKQALDAFVDQSQQPRHRRGAAAPGAGLVPGRPAGAAPTASTTTAWPPTTPTTASATRTARASCACGASASRRGRPARAPPRREAGRSMSDRSTSGHGVSTLWHGRFEGGPADELLAFTVSLAVRPAAGRRRPRRVAGPTCAGWSRAGILDRRRGRRRSWPPSTRSRTSCGRRRVRVRAHRRGHPHRHRATGHRAGRPGRAPSCTPAAAATTRSPPTCACGPSASSARSPGRVLAPAARAARPGRRRPATPTCRATPTCSGPSRCCWPTTCWPTAGRWPATSTACSTAAGASTCRRSAPARWPARRCRSIPTAWPPTSASPRRFENCLDAVSDRDFVAEALFALALLGVHLSRMGEEVVLWSTDEFGFARASTTPTPPARRCCRRRRTPTSPSWPGARPAGCIGNLTGLLATLKGLPLAYNRDLQEDKEPLFDAVDQMALGPVGRWPACYGDADVRHRPDAGGGRLARRGRHRPGRAASSSGACRSARRTRSSAASCATASSGTCRWPSWWRPHPDLGAEAARAARAGRAGEPQAHARAAPVPIAGGRAARAAPRRRLPTLGRAERIGSDTTA